MLFAILVSISVFLITVFFKYAIKRHLWSKKVPGKPVGLFNIFGNVSDVYAKKEKNANAATLQVLCEYAKLFGKQKLYWFWISYIPFVILVKAEAFEEVMSGTRALKKGLVYNFFHAVMGTGLVTSDGERWKSRRKLLQPSFHYEVLRNFIPIFNEQALKLVSVLKKETSKPSTDMLLAITLCSLDIICETMTGEKVNFQDQKESEYVKAIARQAKTFTERGINFLYWADITFKFSKLGLHSNKDAELLKNFTRTMIRKKKEKILNSMHSISDKKKRKGLMDILLEYHVQAKILTEEEIREEVDTFILAGHDTTSYGVLWTLYLIGLYKEVQDKLHEEIDLIFGGDTERPVTTEDLKDMEYMDRVLKESHRIYPPVPFVLRETTADINICGYALPKGTQCLALIYELHRDEDVFPDPENFDPDRFLPENISNRHPYAYIPFSAGPRNCIGQRFAAMEEKIMIIHILRNFTIESLDSRDKVKVAAEVTLAPVKPVRFKIRLRN